MSRYRPDPDKSRRLPPDRIQREDEWHCERCKTEATGRDCPICKVCGQLMFAGPMVTGGKP